MENNQRATTYDVILFDLDGTLIDPKFGITKGVQYALSKLNIIEDDLDELEKFIGPPLLLSFQEFYQLGETSACQAVEFYREYQWDKGMYENYVYQGIPELLTSLKNSGKNLIIATSKLTSLAESILKHLKLYDFFSLVIGSNPDNTRCAKTEVIQYVLLQLPEMDRKRIVMIGDRKHDIIGAKSNGIDSIGVTFGYGSLEELQKSEPTYMVNSVSELGELLLGGKL